MKRLIDIVCSTCGRELFDVWAERGAYPQCECGGQTERLWKSRVGAVHPDEIPGGVLMPNGICNDDGSPKRYYSWSDIRRAAKEKGLTNLVEHVVDPTSGSDKNPHTTRWDATPAYVVDPEAEAERVRHWHLHEATVR